MQQLSQKQFAQQKQRQQYIISSENDQSILLSLPDVAAYLEQGFSYTYLLLLLCFILSVCMSVSYCYITFHINVNEILHGEHTQNFDSF